jgi:hypothetical protein
MTTKERQQHAALLRDFGLLAPGRGIQNPRNQAAALSLFKNPSVSYIAQAIEGTPENKSRYLLLTSLATFYNFETRQWYYDPPIPT